MKDSPSKINFPSSNKKTITATFSGGDISSNAGLMLLAQANRITGVTSAIANAFTDRRQAAKVEHSLETLVQERVFAIASGYEDANDLDDLRDDPILKISCGRTPSGEALASQPTMSRFENDVSPQDIFKAGEALARIVISQFPTQTKVIILDLDATDAPCFGQQEFQGFAGFKISRCFATLKLCHLETSRPTPIPYTRRRFGGRHPLCGIGVTSRIERTSIPEAASARTADSRPDPGPLTRTSTLRTP